MERYAEIGKYAVDPVNPIITQEVGEVSEVAIYHREAVVTESAAHGVLVLVEGIEVSADSKTLDNRA